MSRKTDKKFTDLYLCRPKAQHRSPSYPLLNAVRNNKKGAPNGTPIIWEGRTQKIHSARKIFEIRTLVSFGFFGGVDRSNQNSLDFQAIIQHR